MGIVAHLAKRLLKVPAVLTSMFWVILAVKEALPFPKESAALLDLQTSILSVVHKLESMATFAALKLPIILLVNVVLSAQLI